LKYDADFIVAQPAQLFFGHLEDVQPIKKDLTVNDLPGFMEKADY
jgi:hypothetical protein